MSGISGYIDITASSGYEVLRSTADLMISRISSRGPDKKGIYCEEESGIALAYNHLFITSESALSLQPITSDNGRYVLTYNGEIYNYDEMHAEISYNNPSSDSKILLEYIAAHGLEKALVKANGMFAIALWDKKEKCLYLARDRFGQKPLYYGWCGKYFMWASELSALKANPFFNKEISKGSLALFVRHGFIPSHHTIYDGIHKLQGACLLKIDLSSDKYKGKPSGFCPNADEPSASIKPSRYWFPRVKMKEGIENTFKGTEKDAADKLEELLKTSILNTAQTSADSGVLLSGGVDSSVIAAILQANSAKKIKTYSMGFDSPEYDKAKHAQKIATHLGTEHTEFNFSTQDAINIIPELGSIYSEPFADVGQITSALSMKTLQGQVKVALAGDCGDEFLGGYNRYVWASKLRGLRNSLGKPLCSVLASGINAISVSHLNSAKRGLTNIFPTLANYHRFGENAHRFARILNASDEKSMYLKMVSHWDKPSFIIKDCEEPKTFMSDKSRWVDYSANLNPNDNYITQMMVQDTLFYLCDNILTNVDRASMAYSVEVREPLADYKIYEFACSLPLKYKINNGFGKVPLRNVLYKYVPKTLANRPKTRHYIPIGSWLRNELRPWAEELLDKKAIEEQGFFSAEELQKVWKKHLYGHRNNQYRLWNILMFQDWLKKNS